MCQVEPLGRLGWSLCDLAVKTETFAITRIAVIFYRRVVLGWFFFKMINRQIPHVHQFISEFLELQKYSKVTDCYRLFCFWQILFFMCCLLIMMHLWLILNRINKQTTHEKQNLSKTEQSLLIWLVRILLELQKLWNKLVDLSNLSINLLKNNQLKSTLL